MPTVADKIDICAIAKGCGYKNAVCVTDFERLDKELKIAKDKNELSLIEVKSSVGAREYLGRPTSSPVENKNSFIGNLRE